MVNDVDFYKETLYNTVSICALLEVRLEIIASTQHIIYGDGVAEDLYDQEDLIEINFKAKNASIIARFKKYDSNLHVKYKKIKKKLDNFSSFRNKIVHCTLTKKPNTNKKDIVLVMREIRMYYNLNRKRNKTYLHKFTKEQIEDYSISAYDCYKVMGEIIDEMQSILKPQPKS